MPLLGGAGGKFDTDTFPLGCTAYVGRSADAQDLADDFDNIWYADGTADDVQIQAAITYVSGLGGGCVCLGRGDYDITATLVDAGVNDVTVKGCGYDTVLNLAAGVNTHVFTLTTVDGWVIRDLKIDGNSAGQTAGDGVNLSNVNKSNLRNLWIYDVKKSAIKFVDTSTFNEVHNCYIDTTGSGDVGVWFANSSSQNSVSDVRCYNAGYGFYSNVGAADNNFVNCIANHCQTYGFSTGGANAQFSGCVARYNPIGYDISGTDMVFNSCAAFYNKDFGFRIRGSSFVNAFSGCVAARNGYDGVSTPGGWNYYIEGTDNVLTGCQSNHPYTGGTRLGVGFYVTGDRNTVVGATVFECPVNPGAGVTGHGVEINGGAHNVVAYNVIYNCDGYGVVIDADADYNLVSGNHTTTNTTGCVNVGNANCDNNRISDNNFDEGAIADAGTNTRAWLNYDPSANAFIATINAPAVVGGGGGALP